jgi:uncharacterized membrane protein YkoI
MTKSTKFVSKKILIPAVLGVGILMSAIFVAWPLGNSWAQRQDMVTNNTMMKGPFNLPKINGSVNVVDNMKNFLKESTKIPFSQAAQTAEKQVNGTVIGGHIGVIQGYLVYTFAVVGNQTLYKTIIDAGNGQVLYTSQGHSVGSFGAGPFGHPRGPFGFGFGGFGYGNNFFGHWDKSPNMGEGPWSK